MRELMLAVMSVSFHVGLGCVALGVQGTLKPDSGVLVVEPSPAVRDI
jgi:hypothetical protein